MATRKENNIPREKEQSFSHDLEKRVSLSVCDLFHPPIVERIKTSFARSIDLLGC